MVFMGASAFGASKLEENDRFCTTCHLAAERTYYNRAQFALDHPEAEISDLASYHYVLAQNDPLIDAFRCIDCHRGRQTVPERTKTLGVGIYDGLLYLLGGGSPDDVIGREVEHTTSLIEDGCVNCHGDVLVTLGFNNHYHNYLPAAEEAFNHTGDLSVEPGTSFEQERRLLLDGVQPKNTDVNCMDCHQGHDAVIGGKRVQFIQEETRNEACNVCHRDNDLTIDLTPDD